VLDGNASDNVSLLATVAGLAVQLRMADAEGGVAPLFVADSGLYSAANGCRLTGAGVRWISRVPNTSQSAHAALHVADAACRQDRPDGARF